MFIPEKIVALDAEFTGLSVKKDDILQVAMVKAKFDPNTNQYLVSKDSLNIFIKNDKKATRKFDKEHLQHVFDNCNKSEDTIEDCARKIEEYVGDWKGEAWPMGDCVTTDLRFMYHNNLLTENNFDENENEIKGTLNFRPFELCVLKRLIKELGYTLPKSDLKEHDALNDNYNQLNELNFCLDIILNKGNKNVS